MCSEVFRRHSIIYFFVTVFTGSFAAVYERFGHGVYSEAMLYAYGIPLLLGTGLSYYLSVGARPRKLSYGRQAPGLSVFSREAQVRIGANLLNSGVASLTVGAIVYGILEIYGTTGRLTVVYFYAGLPLVLIGFLTVIVSYLRS